MITVKILKPFELNSKKRYFISRSQLQSVKQKIQFKDSLKRVFKDYCVEDKGRPLFRFIR